jgi:LmbE family N-acetylglucosaminyl deacetylase
MVKKETVIVFSAHSDDYVIGAGGTIKNYTNKGQKVIAIVFSYGEKSHIWLKKKVIQKIRVEEALNASDILGCETTFFDLGDQKIYEDYQKKKILPQLLEILEKEKPSKIFTHSNEDPHPDHRSVNKITHEIYNKLSFKPELYIYSIWNPVSLKTQHPTLCINISKTFKYKLRALKEFKSQRFQAIYPLLLFIFHRAIKNGFKMNKRFGEKFYRIK